MLHRAGNRGTGALLHGHGLLVQRKCACGGGGDVPCHCDEADDDPVDRVRLRPKLVAGAPGDECEREADQVADRVLRTPEAAVAIRGVPGRASGGLTAPAAILDGVGSGAPLDLATRAFFERRMGHDFGGVAVHTGPAATRGAAAVRARAFTVGRDIVFGAGEYAPATREGRRLLAHELTHIVQQAPLAGAGAPAPLARSPTPDAADELRALGIDPRSFAQLWSEFDRHRWTAEDAQALALVPSLISRMSVAEAVDHAGDLAVWLIAHDERELAVRALEELESAWWIRYATGGESAVPSWITGGFGLGAGPEDLVNVGEREAAASHPETARKLLGLAHLMCQMQLARLYEQQARAEEAAAALGEAGPMALAMGRIMRDADIERLTALRTRILNVYPRLASEALRSGGSERAAALGEAGRALAADLTARYTLADLPDVSSLATPVGAAGRAPRRGGGGRGPPTVTTAPAATAPVSSTAVAPPPLAPPARVPAPDRVVEGRPPFEGGTTLALRANHYVFVRSERYAVSERLTRATAWAQNLFGVMSSVVVKHRDDDGVDRYYAAALDEDLRETFPAANPLEAIAVDVATPLYVLPHDYQIMVIHVGRGVGFWPSRAHLAEYERIVAGESALGVEETHLAPELVRTNVFSRIDALMANEAENREEVARLLSQLDATAFATLTSDGRFQYLSVLLRAWTFQAQERAVVEIMRSVESRTELDAIIARLRAADLWEALIDDLDNELWSLLITVGERFGVQELTLRDIYQIMADNGLLQIDTPIPGLSIGPHGPEFSITVFAEIEEAANSFLRFMEGMWDAIVMLVTHPERVVEGVGQLVKMIFVFKLAELGYLPAMMMRDQVIAQFGEQLANGFKGMGVLGVGREVVRRVKWAIIWEVASFFIGIGEIRAALSALGASARVGAIARFLRLLGLVGRVAEAEEATRGLTSLARILGRSGHVLRTEEEVLVTLSHLPDDEAARLARALERVELAEGTTLTGLRAAHPELATLAEGSLRRAEIVEQLAAKAGGFSDDVAIAFGRLSAAGHSTEDLARIVSHIPPGEGQRFMRALRMIGDDLALTGPRGVATLEVLAASTTRMQAVERFGFRAIDAIMERTGRNGAALDHYLDALAAIERELPEATRATAMQNLIERVARGEPDALARLDAKVTELHGPGATRGLVRPTEEGAEGAGRRARGEGGEPTPAHSVPGLSGCRVGSVHCPITYLRDEFPELFARRDSAEFTRYIHEAADEFDLAMRRSLRREMTILTGEPMYAQFLEEVPRAQWSEPFREAVDMARRPGVDHRIISVRGRSMRWPHDDIGAPWVIHHDPPLNWTSLSEGSHLWHPMPYRIHDEAHGWWHDLERMIRGRVRRRGLDMTEDFDIRFFGGR